MTHCLITHCQRFGIRALRHTDHLDDAGASFLRDGRIPVTCLEQDAAYLKALGIDVEWTLERWKPNPFLGGEIIAIPARHGHGWIHILMADGAGFFLRPPDGPSIYISGDTVYTGDVERTLKELRPDIAVVAAGSASLDVGGPILMSLKEILTFVRRAPNLVIANHLEALNHCPTTRSQLRQSLENENLLSKTNIPDDGETMIFEMD